MSTHPNNGFTLIETLLYALFLSFILSGTLGAAYQIIQSSDRLSLQVTAVEEANFLNRKIDWALTDSTISSPAPGTSSSTLSVNKAGSLIFDLNGTDARLKRGAASPLVLNSAAAPVSGLTFYHIAAVGSQPEGIRANFVVNGFPFSITKYLRK